MMDDSGGPIEPDNPAKPAPNSCSGCQWWGRVDDVVTGETGNQRMCGFHKLLTQTEMCCPMWGEK